MASLHALGREVVCYVSAGSYEDWRPDAAQSPAAVKGEGLSGSPGEQWLDIANGYALRPLIEARIDLCRSKGFDGIELDNVDGYQNDAGFPLTANDQLTLIVRWPPLPMRAACRWASRTISIRSPTWSGISTGR